MTNTMSSLNLRKVVEFVKGAVASGSTIPILTHFYIKDGRIQSSDGKIATEAPLLNGGSITAVIVADKFMAALACCKWLPEFTIKNANTLHIAADKFSAELALADQDAFPILMPCDTEPFALPTDFVATLTKLRPFVASDLSRLWSCGVLIEKDSIYATNNIVLAKIDIAWQGPSINISAAAMDELIRIAEAPFAASVNERAVTFFYEGDRWLSAALLSTDWPEELQTYLATIPSELPKLNCTIVADAIERLLPFCPDDDKSIIFGADGISTVSGTSKAQDKTIKCPKSKFKAEHLLRVLRAADKIDLSKWPEPCPFHGPGIVGLISGIE